MSLLRGLADDLPLERWLNDYIFPTESRFVNPDFVNLGTRLACVEMALNGITTFADGYFYMEQSAQAAQDVGLRAVIAQGILDPPTPDAEKGLWQRRVEEFLENCINTDTIQPALFCHSPYLCGPDTYKSAWNIAGSNGLKLFSHVAETAFEVDQVRMTHSMTPVYHLNELGVLGPDFVAVHCIHLSDEEIRILAQTGTPVIHCPESNMKLASGAAKVDEMLAAGVTLGIGTDGPASNNNLDLLQEMRTGSLANKLITSRPESLGAKDLIRMGTIDGARALGLDNVTGSLERGKAADVIVIDMDKPHLTPMYDPVSHLVYSASGGDVRDVIVNGRVVVFDKSIITVDLKQLITAAQDRAGQIASGIGMGSMDKRGPEHD
jgi:5-methylthioadenosine/S-adenosylhomocysteine deaminase